MNPEWLKILISVLIGLSVGLGYSPIRRTLRLRQKGNATNDNLNPVPAERMEKLIEELKPFLKEHEQEKRKSLEVSAGFFDKLAALNAGAIAVSASIILAILFKSEPRPEWFGIALHELLIVVGFLWLSFVLAILHNFLAAVVAKVAAASSEAEFVWTLTQSVISLSQEIEPDLEHAQTKRLLRQQFIPRERRLVKASQALYPTVSIVGYISMLSFAIAFTLVPVFLFRLW
jgi:Trk-type K+ transport system membrane component